MQASKAFVLTPYDRGLADGMIDGRLKGFEEGLDRGQLVVLSHGKVGDPEWEKSDVGAWAHDWAFGRMGAKICELPHGEKRPAWWPVQKYADDGHSEIETRTGEELSGYRRGFVLGSKTGFDEGEIEGRKVAELPVSDDFLVHQVAFKIDNLRWYELEGDPNPLVAEVIKRFGGGVLPVIRDPALDSDEEHDTIMPQADEIRAAVASIPVERRNDFHIALMCIRPNALHG